VTKLVNRTLSIVSAVAVAGLVFGVNIASAHNTSSPTEMFLDEISGQSGDVTATGHLDSPKAGCVPNRTVKLFAVSDEGTAQDPGDDERTLLDTDRTSLNGAFYLEGSAPAGTDYFLILATRKNIGSSGHKHLCQDARIGIV